MRHKALPTEEWAKLFAENPGKTCPELVALTGRNRVTIQAAARRCGVTLVDARRGPRPFQCRLGRTEQQWRSLFAAHPTADDLEMAGIVGTDRDRLRHLRIRLGIAARRKPGGQPAAQDRGRERGRPVQSTAAKLTVDVPAPRPIQTARTKALRERIERARRKYPAGAMV
ncbi:MAG: hypothetical protein AAGF30_00465 [Pseudomonadota bacterium]